MNTPGVDPGLAAAIELGRRTVLEPEVIRTQGAGMAYQVVAQAAAFAVQDASEHLRNVSLLGATTIAVAAARMIETGDAATWREALVESQAIVDRAAESFRRVGLSAAEVLRGFPPESAPPSENEDSRRTLP